MTDTKNMNPLIFDKVEELSPNEEIAGFLREILVWELGMRDTERAQFRKHYDKTMEKWRGSP